ncbi:NAD(P)/FAD-dependent oxidoreductase [Sabulicella rubraurantiaca]|uniref:NAD(P)/FAD-dependent oxidoreductase n=1 Tax=Sabulicella rubraurantiaca TaxID=2811429 RepID=UPI001A964997|nr:NAD(P)/FAD-dependent oxidoreductase [Sabulicella rubraurantiaca]
MRPAGSHGRPPKKIVILGAGFGGLEAARVLARAPVEVTLLDRQNHHLFQPLLYQVATAALSPGDIAWPIRAVFRRKRNLAVQMAEVTRIDVEGRRLHTADGREIPYDRLVLATGATHSYFGHEEWAEHAPGLKTLADATDIRRRLLLAFEEAEVEEDARARRRLLTFVVIGGGPTGVEMAGAIAEVARLALRQEFRRIDPAQARIMLIEAGPRILPSFSEELSEVARASLERLGVEVRSAARVTACHASGVSCEGEEIEARTVVWAAGVMASPSGSWIGAERDRQGRILVAPDLSVPGRPGIYAIGDLAAATDADGRPVPGIAPAAKQMGRHVGKLLAAEVQGQPGPGPFRYRHHGNLATIGRRSAVVQLDGLRLTGLIGWWFWGIAHVWYLIGFRSRIIVSVQWLWSYLTFQRGARLITQPAGEARGARVPHAASAGDAGR